MLKVESCWGSDIIIPKVQLHKRGIDTSCGVRVGHSEKESSLQRKKFFPFRIISVLDDVSQERKQDVIKVISLVKMFENLPRLGKCDLYLYRLQVICTFVMNTAQGVTFIVQSNTCRFFFLESKHNVPFLPLAQLAFCLIIRPLSARQESSRTDNSQ